MKSLKFGIVAFGIIAAPFVANGQFFSNSTFNLSEIKQTGTARYQALGGNHTAVGGDASNIFGNPAGLGFYNRSELSISPMFYNNSTSTDYISSTSTQQKSNLNIGHIGVIFAGTPQNSRNDWRRATFAVSYSKLSNLNNQFQYTGQNNASSFIDWATESAAGVSFDDLDREYNPNTGIAQSIESAVLNLYLMDDTTPNGPPYRRAIPLKGAAAIQNGLYKTDGSTSQWSFAYAGNYADKLYIGASVGIWRSDYQYQHTLNEQYTNAAPFKGMIYDENLTLVGRGINASLGFIYKPMDNLQVGINVTSPTVASASTIFNEKVSVDLTGDIPVYDAAGKAVKNAQGQQQYVKLNKTTIPVSEFDFEYNLTSPVRLSGGATYFFGKMGFITGTAEYVGYNNMRVSTNYYDDTNNNQSFKDNNKKRIKGAFNNVVNLRVGGEARMGYFRVRAGGAYLADPYKTIIDNLDRSRFQYSGGVGLRNDRYFVDVAATFMQSKDAYTNYTMNDARRTASAKISNTGLNFAISGGILF
jgi:hypothetical protein